MDNGLGSHLENQAIACEALGSPFTARVCRALKTVLGRSSLTGHTALNWPNDMRADALALRLCGGFNRLVLAGADAELAEVYPPHVVPDNVLAQALANALTRLDAELADGLGSPPQTNEIARAGMLLPGLLEIARNTGLPMDIVEIGASAGLNLMMDRFHYDYGGKQWRNAGSPVRLAPEVRGRTPPLDGKLDVATRQGCDIAPVDTTTAHDRLRLRSYVWPDQALRLQRLDAALDLAAQDPPRLMKMDALEFVGRQLANRRSGHIFVLMHSIMWQYMPAVTRDGITEMLQASGDVTTADGPIAWLRMEAENTSDPHAALILTNWPGGATRRLALCDFHGRWIEWLA